uniref:Uncharacterized protein n=1 Tax=Arundo donax TaxID=35708 RepID=A0A0A9HI49_ARUDO
MATLPKGNLNRLCRSVVASFRFLRPNIYDRTMCLG